MAKQKKQEKISAPLTSLLLNKKRVLGLDLSLTGTGWVLFNQNESWDSGLIDTDKMKGFDRLDHIKKTIWNVLDFDSNIIDPSEILVVMEDFSFASKGSGLFQIAGLGYIVRYAMWLQEIQFLLVPPTVLKKFVTGKGTSDKSIMLKELFKRWGVDLNDDNVGDAYGLARIGSAIMGWDQKTTDFQKDAVKQILDKQEG